MATTADELRRTDAIGLNIIDVIPYWLASSTGLPRSAPPAGRAGMAIVSIRDVDPEQQYCLLDPEPLKQGL